MSHGGGLRGCPPPADPRAFSSHVTPGGPAPLSAPPAASSMQPSLWLACCAAKPTASAIGHSAGAGTAPSIEKDAAGAFSSLTRLAGGRTLEEAQPRASGSRQEDRGAECGHLRVAVMAE
ncbi:hypothetical protein NN561_006247 [Cricetulus griseus]